MLSLIRHVLSQNTVLSLVAFNDSICEQLTTKQTMILILVICAIATGLYCLNLNYQYWKKRGVPGPKPTFIVGNLLDNFLLKKSLSELYEEVYKNFPDAPMVGIFRASTPTLILRDPELIKDITGKSFQHFHDNDLYIDKDVDPLTGRNPFFMRGEGWKKARAQLSPGFSSGKIKLMHPLMEDVCRRFVKYIADLPSGGHDAKELCKRFTLNNVGICAFGLEAKCFEEENPEFKQVADRFLTPEGWQNVKIFLISIIPALTKLVNIKFTPNDVEEKLTNIVKQTIEYRKNNNIVRNDYMNNILQVMKNDPEFTEIDATAHAAGFFADGYESSSIVMSFMLFNIASNPRVQSKLREEINKAFEENNNSLPYEVLQQLSYLDAVFKECLRLDPPGGSIAKVCTKDYTYVPKSGCVIKQPVVVEAGTSVVLSFAGLHRNPKYFDGPDTFKPERFLSDEREKFKDAYLPFGQGPRACIGQRFGSLQVQIAVAYIIRNFKISVNKKTQLPLKYDPLYFLTSPIGGLWLEFKKINV